MDLISLQRRLESIEFAVNATNKLLEQRPFHKDVLTLKEACAYMGLSQSNVYKLTSAKKIEFFCPQGKKLYFNRLSLDKFLQTNPSQSNEDIEKKAINYTIQNKRK